ncbi:MAG: DUF2953 domain-containing protein [Clostridiales bacterium]|nr:DUF2953 domain-containing protein [Clostridiales bacterium]
MIYIVLAVLFLHISIMRIVLCFEVFFDSDEKSALVTVKLFFITVFKFTPNYNKVVDTATDVTKTVEKTSGKLLRYLARAGTKLIRRIDFRYLGLICNLGTGDAATTALIFGWINSAFDGACSVLDCDNYSEITPDFDMARFYVDFGGIISLCIADIIYAAISALFVKKKTVVKKSLAQSKI